jgi:hypothetical protein
MSTYRFKGEKVTWEELTLRLRELPESELVNFMEAIERSSQTDLEIRKATRAEWKRRRPDIKKG